MVAVRAAGEEQDEERKRSGGRVESSSPERWSLLSSVIKERTEVEDMMIESESRGD